MDAYAIERRVRGLQPWPNAYTTLNDRRLIIWIAEPRVGEKSMPDGHVVEARGDRLVISCGNETELTMVELQPEAGRRMAVRDFLNGARLVEGAPLQPN